MVGTNNGVNSSNFDNLNFVEVLHKLEVIAMFEYISNTHILIDRLTNT
jgi:hypothetical protein